MNFHSARQIFDEVAVTAAVKSNTADERVEICRNQANSDKNENPCKWCGNAIYRGFCYFILEISFLDTITIYRYNQ